MKLYLVHLTVQFSSHVDMNNGFVVAASSPSAARRMSSEEAMGEGKKVWLNPRDSSCQVIGEAKAGQKAEVILQSAHAV